MLIKRQIDDFEVAVPSERIGNILFDQIDELLTFPLKHLLAWMYYKLETTSRFQWKLT